LLQGLDRIANGPGREIELQTDAAERLLYEYIELVSILGGVWVGGLACVLPVPSWPAGP